MVELNPFRKNKINLEDYDYQKDIENRLLMAHFSEADLEVLEELLYNPPKFPIDTISSNLDMTLLELTPILKKLGKTGLFTIIDENIIVDKEMRKYFEFQLHKFDDDFKPGMEFLQSLLKKVPIHVLPVWYHIPRTSNNIFDSLIEKYLETPQTFQRYLLELNLADDVMKDIVEDLFREKSLKLLSSEVMTRRILPSCTDALSRIAIDTTRPCSKRAGWPVAKSESSLSGKRCWRPSLKPVIRGSPLRILATFGIRRTTSG